MIKSIIDSYRKRKTYKSTYNELSSLSNRELYDLGIERCDIHKIAYESAYGKEIEVKEKPFKISLFKTDKERMHEYLAESANLIDLENRLRSIDRGEAPWQKQHFMLSKGFV